MKKFLSVVMIMMLALSLSACRTEAAKNADKLINDIGTVTLESGIAIVSAEEAVAALSDEEKESLKKAEILTTARAAYDFLVAIDETERAIADIGTVTIESEEAVNKARDLYDGCTQEVKDKITNYEVLEKAESEFRILKTEDLISKLGTVTLLSNDAITAAENSYNILTIEEKTVVSNYDILTLARSEYNKLEKAQKDKELQAALSKLKSKYDKVTGITWYKASTQPKYANTRSYVLSYIGKDSTNSWLRLNYLYTGDDWVFWKKLTFAIDGKNYYRSYNYFDITHDNAHGDVWEYIDVLASSEDIKLLKAIANSNETIVRFQGDNYHKDLTIKASDKQAIKEVLTAYELMK